MARKSYTDEFRRRRCAIVRVSGSGVGIMARPYRRSRWREESSEPGPGSASFAPLGDVEDRCDGLWRLLVVDPVVNERDG
jgi:hypothetical protein